MLARRKNLLRSSLLVALIGCGSGGDDDGPDDLTPVDELPWPTEPSALPSCDPFPGGFGLPEIASPTGSILAVPSASMQPTGELELVELTVLDAPGGSIDVNANGVVTATLASGGEVVSVSAVDQGRATMTVRLDSPGAHALSLTFEADGRTGSAELHAFETQLPTWTLTIDPLDLEKLLDLPDEGEPRVEVAATLHIDGQSYETEVRLHGGSSRSYPKKSFRIDLDKGLTDAGERHLILRSEFNDKTQLRNWLSLDLFRNGTWLPTSRSELVHLRINDTFYGVMNHVQRIDSDMLMDNDLSPSASLYEADPPRELASPGGNLTPLSGDLYAEVYQWHNGGEEYRDLIELIEDTLLKTEANFAATAGDDIAIDNMLVYLAMMAAIQNHDHIRKNYYIYRDIYADEDRWFKIPWDLELTLGHLWTEENDVFEEQLFVGEDIFVGEQAPERFGYYNQLIERLLAIPQFRQRFLAMLDRIVSVQLSDDFVMPRLENALCRATPDLLADPNKRASNEEMLGRVDEIYQFVGARRAFVFEELARLAP